MYTDEDLNQAVDKGIFTATAVEQFRQLVSVQQNSPSVDEENFRLIGGFNDIFIVIACGLLIFSSAWVLSLAHELLGALAIVVLAWGLSEYFVRKRKMALPAIGLLLAFSGGTFFTGVLLFGSLGQLVLLFTAAITTAATYCHWLRFRVPITIATSTAAGAGLLMTIAEATFPPLAGWRMVTLFICGVSAFVLAMAWDATDTTRTTRRSDVAFWLHLLSAPMIIHPIFSGMDVLHGNDSPVAIGSVVVLYLVMTLLSLAIDRRAFMVSSLGYVLYAISSLLKNYGGIGASFAVTGVIMGSALLLLSAFWHTARIHVVASLPEWLQSKLPQIPRKASKGV